MTVPERNETVLYESHPSMFRNHPFYFVLCLLLSVVGVGLMIAQLFKNRVLFQPYLALTLGVLALLLTSWLLRPRAALYVTLFLTMVGDIVTAPW